MAVLAIFQPDARTSARLSGVLGRGHRLVARRSWDGVERVLTQGDVEGCLVDADHPKRSEAERRIQQLRSRHPTLAIIAYVEAGRKGGYFDLGGLGVDGLITSDTPRYRIRADVDQAFARARGAEVGRAVASRFPGVLQRTLSWAVTHATNETSVDEMAEAFGETTRGLRRALAQEGLPPPSRILLWGRLLLAGARLERDGRSVEEVAFSLGYATSTSLARAMKDHTGHTPRQISERGGMLLVLERLLPRPRRSDRVARGSAGVAVLLVAIATSACATLGLGSAVDRRAIEDVLSSPGIEQMHVGILAIDAASGETLFDRNAHRKFVPASNQKILVTAAAMTMLGPDFRFRTEVWSTGHREGGLVDGDLVLVGSGDPTLSGRYWPSGTSALEALADSLRSAGVERVSGTLQVDVSAWDSSTVGPTWEVEDLRYAYGSTGGAFAMDEGEVQVVVKAGPAVGLPARVRWSPMGTEDYVHSKVETTLPDSSTRVTPHYLPESRRLVLEGAAEWGTVDTMSFALRDPVRQASAALARVIREKGIEIDGGWEVRWTAGEPLGGGCASGAVAECATARRIAVLESPRLAEIVAGILKPSQNWMTEQLIRSLAALFGDRGSWSEGADLVEAFLFEHVGVDTLDVSTRDGSGLSAYNLVTPRALVRVLRHMRSGPHAAVYRAALAQPGEEGSLERRLTGLEGRVFAKTGTISNVNSLSGYLVRDDGREVVFSILTNASGLPSSYVRDAIDDIVRALAR